MHWRQTLFDKIWQLNLVRAESIDQPALLYVGLHLLHEITSPQAFAAIEAKGQSVRRPDLTLAMVDHCAPSTLHGDGSFAFKDERTQKQIDALEHYCQKYAIPCLDLKHRYQGIVHAVAPELGLSRPGQVIVCGDSHTATHGAFGAIAFGIGSSEVAHVLATQCILLRKPKNYCINIEGSLAEGVSAKDLALHIIKIIGAAGAQGYAIEYQGSTIRDFSMEQRLTLCNMTIEAGSRFGIIAPDATTVSYLTNCPLYQNQNAAWLKELYSDKDAEWDKILTLSARDVLPMMTWGTNPAMSIPYGQRIPAAETPSERLALSYMGWQAEDSPQGRSVDHVFIGSCTNGRISDLRAAAEQMQGLTVAGHIKCLIVPASRQIKRQAEQEGLDRIFKQAGAIWGEPSCSLCNAMNGDAIASGQLCVSTSNRNFEGRQGPGARTILASPVTAAQIAIRGFL